MTIAIDATYSVGGSLSGVGRYSREILFGLAQAHPEQRFRFAYRAHRLRQSLADSLPANASRRLLHGAFPRVDLLHGLNQRLDAGRFRHAVATVHDLFVLTGEYSTPEFRERFAAQARQAARRADLVIAVSAFTADQVHNLLGVERSRIRVIHHGVRGPANPPPDSARRNFILHVGAIQSRKNIVRLIRAFEATPPGWNLILAGSAGYGAAEAMAAIEASPRREDIRVFGYVTDSKLAELYDEARVLAFPSLDEGFGIPVIEAMAHGLPVLTSNASALREVAGDAALLVDPADQDAIASGLRELTASVSARDDWRIRGLAHAALFEWKTAVDKTWAVYEELLP
ncbi:MAG: glycosyltransferase family 1 protein [Bryobacteraceae bacterium]